MSLIRVLISRHIPQPPHNGMYKIFHVILTHQEPLSPNYTGARNMMIMYMMSRKPITMCIINTIINTNGFVVMEMGQIVQVLIVQMNAISSEEISIQIQQQLTRGMLVFLVLEMLASLKIIILRWRYLREIWILLWYFIMREILCQPA